MFCDVICENIIANHMPVLINRMTNLFKEGGRNWGWKQFIEDFNKCLTSLVFLNSRSKGLLLWTYEFQTMGMGKDVVKFIQIRVLCQSVVNLLPSGIYFLTKIIIQHCIQKSIVRVERKLKQCIPMILVFIKSVMFNLIHDPFCIEAIIKAI